MDPITSFRQGRLADHFERKFVVPGSLVSIPFLTSDRIYDPSL
jgi:hypothetical protein